MTYDIDNNPSNLEVFSLWIDQLKTDSLYAKTEAQKKEYDEWVEWLELQYSNNRTRDIWVHHWRLEGCEHKRLTINEIYKALQKEDGIYPDLEEEEGPSTLDHIDV